MFPRSFTLSHDHWSQSDVPMASLWDYVVKKKQLQRAGDASGAIQPDEVLGIVKQYGMDPLTRLIIEQVLGTGGASSYSITYETHSSLYSLVSMLRLAANVQECIRVFELLITTYVEGVGHALAGMPPGDARLSMLCKQWIAHRLIVEWMVRVFRQCDLVDRKLSLTSYSHRQFKAVVYVPIREMLVSYIIDLVHRDRLGEVIDRTIVKSAVHMFMIMSVIDTEQMQDLRNDVETSHKVSCIAVNPEFREGCQDVLVDATRKYYSGVSETAIESMDISTYLTFCERELNQEDARCRLYFPNEMRVAVLNDARWYLLAFHCSAIIYREGSGLAYQLRTFFETNDQERLGAITCLYKLFAGVPSDGIVSIDAGLSSLASAFVDSIKEHGVNRCVSGAGSGAGSGSGAGAGSRPMKKVDPDDVKHLVTLLHQAQLILKTCFQCTVDMKRALHKAMEEVLNSDPNHAEMIAVTIDMALRGRLGKLSEKDTGETVGGCLDLLPFLADKDLFREHVGALLCKRLLQNKSVSNDLELAVISQLKATCGPQYTKKMEDMMQDLTVSADACKLYVASQRDMPIDAFQVSVLKTSAWPVMHMFPSVVLPPAMLACKAHFNSYYQAQSTKRVLAWAFGQGSAELQVLFSEKVCVTVAAGTLQALVLLTFNQHPVISVRELADVTMLDMVSLKTILGSMLFAKDLMVLKKTPESKTIDESHILSVNASYRSASRKISLPLVALQDKTSVATIVSAEQMHVLDAITVRNMKTRKVMSHVDLVQAIMTQCLFFRPDVRKIKQRIEDLMKRGFIKREDPDVHTSPYVYVPSDD